MLNSDDIQFIKERGSDVEEVKSQIENFKTGFPPLVLSEAATIGNGIHKYAPDQIDRLIQLYEKGISGKKIIKFVPASGAASRMFKALFEFISNYDATDEAYENMQSDWKDVYEFFKNIEKFAFYDQLQKTYSTKHGESLAEAIIKRKYVSVLKTLLKKDGMMYGVLPKGLLQFHQYEKSSRTPVEEHIIEGIKYAKDDQNNVNIHLTVSPEHKPRFESHVATVISKYESEYGVKINIDYSEQKKSTDTIAVDMDNAPFEETEGKILFRPGGHGALIENLNDLIADIIFVKNIDNVVPDHLKGETITYKKVLGGLLIDYQNKTFDLIKQLNIGTDEPLINKAVAFIEQDLCCKIPETVKSLEVSAKKDVLLKLLQRPLRICGMVKNEGEPGGGPFWSEDENGFVQLQIVESAQVDLENKEQKEIFGGSTHFNPVDLVCAVKDMEGNKFDLLNYRDPKTGFIAYKSKGGRELKAQELPGLWNGAMAFWNTVFVEVPLITFNPVKKVTDLLKDTHQ